MAGFPAVLAFLLIYIFPMGMTMVYSFLENSFSKTPVGFDNYVYVWGKPSFQQALQNTASLRQTRRDIARVRTILTEKATTK